MQFARLIQMGPAVLPRPHRGCGRRAPSGRRLAAGLVLAFACLAPLACSPGEEEALIVQENRAPVQVVEQMVLRESEGGRLRWTLIADSALSYGEEEPTLLVGVHVDFYDAAGESIRSVLTARLGEVDARTKTLVARGDVVVRAREGHRLETEELRWDPEIEKVVSDRFVRLVKGESVVTGTGIESDPGLRSYMIRSEVEGQLREEDELLDEF
jgi:LPS export ABC transporter protein LptC